jgi:phage head maturation protease
LGDELLENLRRGEVNQSSFSFTVAEDKWAKDKNGKWSRSISKFDELYDVSPVYNAAYSKTSVYMRGKEDLEKQEDEIAQHEREELYNKTAKLLNI